MVTTAMSDVPFGKLLSRDLTEVARRYFVQDQVATKQFHARSFESVQPTVIKSWVDSLPNSLDTIRVDLMNGIWRCVAGCSYDSFILAAGTAIIVGIDKVYDAKSSVERDLYGAPTNSV